MPATTAMPYYAPAASAATYVSPRDRVVSISESHLDEHLAPSNGGGYANGKFKILKTIGSFRNKAKKSGLNIFSERTMMKTDSFGTSSIISRPSQYQAFKQNFGVVFTGQRVLTEEQKSRQELIEKAKRLGIAEEVYQ